MIYLRLTFGIVCVQKGFLVTCFPLDIPVCINIIMFNYLFCHEIAHNILKLLLSTSLATTLAANPTSLKKYPVSSCPSGQPGPSKCPGAPT